MYVSNKRIYIYIRSEKEDLPISKTFSDNSALYSVAFTSSFVDPRPMPKMEEGYLYIYIFPV